MCPPQSWEAVARENERVMVVFSMLCYHGASTAGAETCLSEVKPLISKNIANVLLIVEISLLFRQEEE